MKDGSFFYPSDYESVPITSALCHRRAQIQTKVWLGLNFRVYWARYVYVPCIVFNNDLVLCIIDIRSCRGSVEITKEISNWNFTENSCDFNGRGHNFSSGGGGGFWLCQNKTYLIPRRSICYSKPINSVRDDWSPTIFPMNTMWFSSKHSLPPMTGF